MQRYKNKNVEKKSYNLLWNSHNL